MRLCCLPSRPVRFGCCCRRCLFRACVSRCPTSPIYSLRRYHYDEHRRALMHQAGVFGSVVVLVHPTPCRSLSLPLSLSRFPLSRRLPSLTQLMSVVYVALTAAWLGEMLRLRRHVLPVHSLCLACVVVKTVQFILRAVYFHRQVGGCCCWGHHLHDHLILFDTRRACCLDPAPHREQALDLPHGAAG